MPQHPGRRKMPMKAREMKMREIFHELKENPPAVLAKTRHKSGAKRAEKQRVAIAMSKARRG